MTDTGFTNSKFVKTTEKIFLKGTPSIFLAPLWGGGHLPIPQSPMFQTIFIVLSTASPFYLQIYYSMLITK